MNKLVSIIIPVYNVQKYLNQCLDSVFNQTYTNLEIILIDDGSKDQSGAMCDDYLKKDSRAKVIHQNNMGLSGARNSGLDIATGEYIMCIDSDDMVEPSIVEKLLNALEECNADVSVCGTAYCSETGEVLCYKNVDITEVFKGTEQLEALVNSEKISTTAWGKLYKRELFLEIRYPIGKWHEDVFTTYLLLDRSNSTVVINEPLYIYRQNQNSIMHQKFNIQSLDGLEGTIERAEYIAQKYPELSSASYAMVAYTGCKLYEKMILCGNFVDKKIETYLRNIVRKYFFDLLKNRNVRIITKMFAVGICICPKLILMVYPRNEV